MSRIPIYVVWYNRLQKTNNPRSLSVRSHPPRSSGLSAPSRVALPECFNNGIDYYILSFCSFYLNNR